VFCQDKSASIGVAFTLKDNLDLFKIVGVKTDRNFFLGQLRGRLKQLALNRKDHRFIYRPFFLD